MKQMEMEL